MTDTEENTALATVATTAIVPSPQPQGLTVASLDEAEKMAEKLAASSLVPDHFQGKPSDCFMAIAFGVELGLPPVTSLASIAVVKGKPTLYAATMVALVMASGKAKSFNHVSSSATEATYETVRHGQKLRRYTFTMQEAKDAQLTFDGQNSKSMYSKYAKQMLEARAKSFLCRDVYPDVLHGLEGYEEVRDRGPRNAIDVDAFEEPEEASAAGVVDDIMKTGAEIAIVMKTTESEAKPEENPDAVSLLDQLLGCKTMEELDGMTAPLSTLEGADRQKAMEIYRAQKKTIEASA